MDSIEDNLSNEELWDTIYKGFSNDVCKDCCNQILPFRDLSKPQPIPYIGPNFGRDIYRLMFVGIETYCNEKRDNCTETEYDEFLTDQVKSLFFEMNPEENRYSPFWKWVKKISEDVLEKEPEDAFKHIAYSNLHKCQSREKGSDLCSPNYKIIEELSINCIQKAGWLYREIEEIGARNIILFSGRRRECFLARLLLGDEEGRLIRKFDYSHCGLDENILKKRKNRDLFIHLRDGARRFIITNHPQGTPHQILDEIIRIIKHNDWNNALDWKLPKSYGH
jgi:hypothetical protein